MTSASPPKTPRGAAPGGFTLPELLVVIGIIVILIGLGTFGMSKMMTRAKGQNTQTMLQTAANAETEYHAHAQTQLHINRTGSNPIDFSSITRTAPLSNTNSGNLSNTSDPYNGIERFVAACVQVPSARKILVVLKPHLTDKDGDGFAEITDGWDTPLKYFNKSTAADNDEGVPVHTTADGGDAPFFASAGPDKAWGKYTTGGVPNAAARDNVFSFDLGQDE